MMQLCHNDSSIQGNHIPDHTKFPDFSSGDSNIAFDVCFNDNIKYSTACFIHEQENHHLCFNWLLCWTVCKNWLWFPRTFPPFPQTILQFSDFSRWVMTGTCRRLQTAVWHGAAQRCRHVSRGRPHGRWHGGHRPKWQWWGSRASWWQSGRRLTHTSYTRIDWLSSTWYATVFHKIDEK